MDPIEYAAIYDEKFRKKLKERTVLNRLYNQILRKCLILNK